MRFRDGKFQLRCYAVRSSHTRVSIYAGWSDGAIRSFYPQSGKLQSVIRDAQQKAVTALVLPSGWLHVLYMDGGVGGGVDGQDSHVARQSPNHATITPNSNVDPLIAPST
eukprot:GHVU01053763.1.p2 GENE.GHVU01053763.1~~GHVU01053763.1.p2  ORF type:complete len:110 (+),score=3.26 GHVU01053763.1:1193-1522(+)